MKGKQRELPTQARLRELFDYRDGVLYHKVNRGKGRRGAPAGCISCGNGYTRLYSSVKGRHHPVHRLVWVWHYGNIPANMDINHINGDRTDNRIANLRLANHADVCRNSGMNKNNTSGFKGVVRYKNTNKWLAQITVNYRNIPLGRFDTKEEAHAAYCVAADKYFGEFANFGTPRQYDLPLQKEPRQSSGQMTQGAVGRDFQKTGSNEANHNIALTDNAPATQAPERAAMRQTRAAEGVTGVRFCKRCTVHRKSSCGLFLTDAINLCYWVCQSCSEGYHTQRASSQTHGIKSDAGRAEA